jgi:hypothetical protein
MATHKQTMKMIDEFLEHSRKYREKGEKKTLKDDALWLQKYNDLQKAISEYDVDKINYTKGAKV